MNDITRICTKRGDDAATLKNRTELRLGRRTPSSIYVGAWMIRMKQLTAFIFYDCFDFTLLGLSAMLPNLNVGTIEKEMNHTHSLMSHKRRPTAAIHNVPSGS